MKLSALFIAAAAIFGSAQAGHIQHTEFNVASGPGLKDCYVVKDNQRPSARGSGLEKVTVKFDKREAQVFGTFPAGKCAEKCFNSKKTGSTPICKAFSLTANADGSLACYLHTSAQANKAVPLEAEDPRFPAKTWLLNLNTKKCNAANKTDLSDFDLPPKPAARPERAELDNGRKPKADSKKAGEPKVDANGKVEGSGPGGRVTWEDVQSKLSLDELQLKDAVIAPDDVDVSFEDIVGLDRVKQALRENVILPSINPRMFKGPLLQPAKGILLFGPPGNGKTYIAKAVAHEAGANFLSISVSDIGSKWHGQGEKMMQAVFSLARLLQPTVVFFDEVDSLLTKRSDTEHDANRRIKTEFLTGLDGMSSVEGERVLALAATNLPYDLDDAALRRFPERFFVELPNQSARANIIRKMVEDETKKTFNDTDINTLARVTPCYSASDLTNLINAAFAGPLEEVSDRFNAAVESGKDMSELHINVEELRPVTPLDLYTALKKVKPQAKGELLTKLIEWNKDFGAVAVEGPGSATGEQCASSLKH